MRVRFNKDHEVGTVAYRGGSSADLPDKEARAAVKSGAAEETVIVRFRRGGTVGQMSYSGGQRVELPADEEVWKAINDGTADMDPAPGVAGQPFPPEELTEAPAEVRPVPVMATIPTVAATTTGTDYDAMTVEDLHQEASRRNLEGRSELKTKADLTKALQKHDRKK